MPVFNSKRKNRKQVTTPKQQLPILERSYLHIIMVRESVRAKPAPTLQPPLSVSKNHHFKSAWCLGTSALPTKEAR